MKWLTSQRLNSVLGLDLTGGRLSAAQVTRAKGAVAPARSFTAALSLDPWSAPVEEAGREIKQHLAAAGLRERHCVVAIPAPWIISRQTQLPALSPEDLASYLQLEAEKGLPCDPSQVRLVHSLCHAGGVTYATLIAVRTEPIDRLTAVLLAAGLKPVSFTPGLAALPDVVPPSEGRITVALEPGQATLLVAAGGGIAALRTCEVAPGDAAAAGLIRELRITWEQVPAALRAGVKRLEFSGGTAGQRPLADRVAAWARAAGLAAGQPGAGDQPLGGLMADHMAQRWLEAGAPALEFLPPRPSRWTAWLARYDSKRLAVAGFAVAAAAVLAIGAFGWQEYRRWSLQSEWGAMQQQVTGLEAVQSLIREYRPWYDTSFHTLSILRRVTESFPDNGSVTAKSLEVHGATDVSISGTARDNPALLRTLDQLRKTREIRDLKVEQIRGKAPLQFTVSFHWSNPTGP